MHNYRESKDISGDTIPFRITIGVTGHRELANYDDIARQVNEVLNDHLMTFFSDDSLRLFRSCTSTPIRLNVLTPLAEGADRLVSREVLKFPDSRIEVILPLAKEDYLQDFTTDESKQEFEELFQMARRPVTLRQLPIDCEFSKEEHREARKKAYEDVGRYIVDHCDILIAIWDGNGVRGRGGTADVVAYAREKRCPIVIIPTHDPFNFVMENGEGFKAGPISKIEEYNASVVSEGVNKEYVENVFADLFHSEAGSRLSPEVKNTIKHHLLPYYVTSSEVAKKHQKIYRRIGISVYFFSAVSVGAVAVGTLVHKISPFAYLLEFILLLGIISIVTYADKKKSHEKWIENRFLSERIRSFIYFAACGIEPARIQVPPYIRFAHNSSDWMVIACQEIWNRLPKATAALELTCSDILPFIRKHWIQDQMNYHSSKSLRLKTTNHRFEVWGLRIFFLAIIAALLHLLLFVTHLGHVYLVFEHLLTFLAISLPALGASIGGFRAHREYERMALRSQSQADILNELDEKLSFVTRREHLTDLLHQMDEIMLQENQDWLVLVRFLKLEAAA